ncbi:uncharacterized protein LOC136078299 [Hydra vulgaris]
MGHSEKMNQDFYQDPLALLELTRVGKQLMKIDAESDKEVYENESGKNVVDIESDENVVQENHTLTSKGNDVFGIKEKVSDFPNKEIMFDNPTLKNNCSSSIKNKKKYQLRQLSQI